MVSDSTPHFQPPPFLTGALWLAAVAGLLIPPACSHFSSASNPWAQQAADAFHASQHSAQWQGPWVAIGETPFAAAWIRCDTLADAIALDQAIDDGLPHSGNLLLTTGGLAWLP
jgi:hypothetical protein